MDKTEAETLWLVYDGDCVLCRSGALGYRVNKAVGRLQTLDARSHAVHPVLREIHTRQLDLNQGIVVVYGDQWRHGADALNLLAMLGSNHDALNRFNAWLFRSPRRARWLYPLMRAGRNLSLKLAGKTQI
ncbi:DCC1-like thiol-disulfide oxidoreductase family protein [Asticcacaulis sp. AND118]|uniref:DCC1-like thiol-disulfide oxidoreductase family protein n=1 Tax=Asticcacaulis sp. AND118 TaxID=2840468 RepID=UPI001CFFD469|nr:DCC1-like thiol-disulfide oxidoreductase family protein [Asticcacaulis sp. AND118]UDF04200.1 DUF393 domain-containing protein [Asticcacaulis sp. AND118]